VEPVKRIKAWLLAWLGAASTDRTKQIRESLRKEISRAVTVIRSKKRSKMDAEIIQELNAIRNRPPVIEPNKGAVRVFRNFREFRSAIEGQRPIKIERKSS
jgi:hypothetical protein